jgi:hypothetical protein
MLFSRFLQRTHATTAAYAARRLPFRCPRAFHASAVRRLLDMEKVNTSARLTELRRLMHERQIDVYSTVSCSENGASPLTTRQWCLPKTATRASTLRLAMHAAV